MRGRAHELKGQALAAFVTPKGGDTTTLADRAVAERLKTQYEAVET